MVNIFKVNFESVKIGIIYSKATHSFMWLASSPNYKYTVNTVDSPTMQYYIVKLTKIMWYLNVYKYTLFLFLF